MKIAIVKLSALGDIVHAMLALQLIKTQRPDIEIDWLVEERFADILHHNPHINRVLPVNLKGLKRDKRLLLTEIKRIRGYARQHYDLVIDAQGLLKSAICAKLLGKNVVGFNWQSIREPLATLFYQQTVECPYETNTIIRNLRVLTQALGVVFSERDILTKDPFLYFSTASTPTTQADKTLKTILLVVGSTWESRNYPAEKYITLANLLAQHCLVIWGNAIEREKAVYMASQSPYIHCTQALDLNQLKALMATVDLVIGNDTGPTHMAWGLNIPSITLFGCTPVNRIYLTASNLALKSSSVVNPRKLNRQDDSVKEISPESIANLARDLLKLA